jgi:hypothetical protein
MLADIKSGMGGRMESEFAPKPPFNLQEIKLRGGPILQMQILPDPRKIQQNNGVQDTSHGVIAGGGFSWRHEVR